MDRSARRLRRRLGADEPSELLRDLEDWGEDMRLRLRARGEPDARALDRDLERDRRRRAGDRDSDLDRRPPDPRLPEDASAPFGDVSSSFGCSLGCKAFCRSAANA